VTQRDAGLARVRDRWHSTRASHRQETPSMKASTDASKAASRVERLKPPSLNK
jgi:hypothetical protein